MDLTKLHIFAHWDSDGQKQLTRCFKKSKNIARQQYFLEKQSKSNFFVVCESKMQSKSYMLLLLSKNQKVSIKYWNFLKMNRNSFEVEESWHKFSQFWLGYNHKSTTISQKLLLKKQSKKQWFSRKSIKQKVKQK